VVKHRPPENREPQPSEIEACKEYLDEQIKIIQPKIIVTLGRFSLEKFVPEGRISQAHGLARFAEFNGRKIIIIPMYHPAAALRGEQVMKTLKEDFQKITKFLVEEKEAESINSPVEVEEEKKEDSQLSFL